MAKFDFSSSTGLNKAIASVVNRSRTLQSDIQKVAIACMEHAVEHGDVRPAVSLVGGITKNKGVKHTALKAYMETFMVGTFKSESFEYDEGFNASTIMLDMAREVNWFDFKPAPKVKVADVQSILDVAFKEADRAIKQGNLTEEQKAELALILDDYAVSIREDAIEEVELPELPRADVLRAAVH